MTKRFEEFRPLSSFLVLCLAMALASSCSDKKKDEGIPQDESKTSHPSNGGDSDATFGERDDDDVELIGTVVAVQEQPGTNSPSPSGTGEFSVGPIEGASGVYGNEFEIPGAQVNCCFQRGNRPAEQFLGVVAYVDPVLTVYHYDAAHGGFVRLAIGSEIAPIHEFFLSKDPRDTLIVARAENKKRITHSTEIVNIGELVFSMKESAENDIPSPLSDRKTEELQAELAQLQQQWADEIFTIKKPMEEAIRGPEWKSTKDNPEERLAVIYKGLNFYKEKQKALQEDQEKRKREGRMFDTHGNGLLKLYTKKIRAIELPLLRVEQLQEKIAKVSSQLGLSRTGLAEDAPQPGRGGIYSSFQVIDLTTGQIIQEDHPVLEWELYSCVELGEATDDHCDRQ